jgi:hypothetical protein
VNEAVAITADVGTIDREGDIAARPTCAAITNYTTLFVAPG